MKFSIQSVYAWYRNLIRNPKYRWWIILGTLLYFVSPIDVVPDFLPIVGEVDDVFLLTLMVSEVSGLLIEGFKARKDNVASSNATTTTADNSPSNSEATIDVDAVSVK